MVIASTLTMFSDVKHCRAREERLRGVVSFTSRL